MSTIEIIVFILTIAIFILLVHDLLSTTIDARSELKYMDYIYYAKFMLIDAIHEYNVQCIKDHEPSFVNYKDVMDYVTACNMYPNPIGWRDLISKDKLELLKPYLPEDPDKYIYDKVIKGAENK